MEKVVIKNKVDVQKTNRHVPVPVIIFAVLIIGLGAIFLLTHWKNNVQANLSCTSTPGQSCSEILCEGDQKGTGTCGSGLFCCKPIAIPASEQNKVTLVSDVSSVKLSNVNQASLTQLANDQGIFNNPHDSFHNVHGQLDRGHVQAVTVRITNLTSAPLYNHNIVGITDPTQAGYGDVFDSRNGHLTMFIYFTDSLLLDTSESSLTNMIWHTTLLMLYETAHGPATTQTQINSENAYITAHQSKVLFTLHTSCPTCGLP